MIALAGGMFAVLAGIAALHLYWAFGGLWPATSPTELARTVIGSDGMPGRGLTILVAALILTAGAWPLVHLNGLVPAGFSRLGLWALVAVFLARGLVTYALPGTAQKTSEPFRSLNARYFSPLCLALGVGFMAIVFGA
ncbi:MAG: DUF3995 domain-containing protein [Alphaproteobacteria bacterium]|nr:DUF3995 domain-containing protein [Alphaproteobacteria bacterium]